MRSIEILALGAAAAAAGVAAFSASPASAANIGGSHLDDYLYGTPYADTIYGFEGNDSLYGYAGADQIFGGPGYDYLAGADGRDVLRGGTVTATTSTAAARRTGCTATPAHDTLVPGFGTDEVRGGLRRRLRLRLLRRQRRLHPVRPGLRHRLLRHHRPR